MLTAHLPAGYVLSRAAHARNRLVIGATLLGSVLPDFDLFFFYLMDDRAFHHHRYWVHIPAFWFAIMALSLPLLWRTSNRTAALMFFAAIFLHLVLDSVGGEIMWAAPFSTRLFALVTVPATQKHWILSFILHWTFLLEIAVWLLAAALFLRREPA